MSTRLMDWNKAMSIVLMGREHSQYYTAIESMAEVVAAFCKHPTHDLFDYLWEGSYDGDEGPASLAAQYDGWQQRALDWNAAVESEC